MGDRSEVPGEKISKDLIDLGTQVQIYKRLMVNHDSFIPNYYLFVTFLVGSFLPEKLRRKRPGNTIGGFDMDVGDHFGNTVHHVGAGRSETLLCCGSPGSPPRRLAAR